MALLAHEIPGRLRFVVTRLKGDRSGAESLRARTLAIPAVTCALANPLTGSLVVTYDPALTARDRILAELDLLVPGIAACAGSGGSMPTRRAEGRRSVTAIVADALAEALVERTIRIAVAALV